MATYSSHAIGLVDGTYLLPQFGPAQPPPKKDGSIPGKALQLGRRICGRKLVTGGMDPPRPDPLPQGRMCRAPMEGKMIRVLLVAQLQGEFGLPDNCQAACHAVMARHQYLRGSSPNSRI